MEEQLEPEVIPPSTVVSQRQHLQQRQRDYHNRAAVPAEQLQQGDHVVIQDQATKLWSPGVITRAANAPRSYEIETPNGAVYRRNTRHIKRDHTQTPPETAQQPEPPVTMPPESGDDQYRTASGRAVKPVDRLTYK